MIEALARRTRKRQFDVACLAFGVGRSSSFHYSITPPPHCLVAPRTRRTTRTRTTSPITHHSSPVT